MARPDLDDGYLRYAHELDTALACADFTKGARIVLREVFSQIFGPARKRTAKVFPSDLARMCGLEKSNLIRSIRELTESGVLARVGECEYRFLKDYEAWTRGGARGKKTGRRLTGTEVAMAKDAPRHAMSFNHVSGVNRDTNNKPKQQTSGVNRDTDGVNPDTVTVSIGTPNGVNPDTGAHYVEPARSEKARDLLEKGLLAGKPQTIACDPSLCEADRIGEQVEDWFPGSGWGREAFEMCKTHSTASVEWGFRTANAKALKGERLTLKRVIGLVKFAEENPMDARVNGAGVGAAPASRPMTEAQSEREAKRRRLEAWARGD